MNPWFLTSSLGNRERIHFCCFKPSTEWSFVTAVTGNQYGPPESLYLIYNVFILK